MSTVLIRNVIHEGNARDVLIRGECFERIEPRIEEAAERVIDAGGRKAILPAFYNAHTHAAMTLLRGYADDLPLHEWLQDHIWPVEARMTAEDIYNGARLACLEMIRSGTVFFNDMYWQPEQTIRAAVEMGLRVCTGPIVLDAFASDQTAAQQDAVTAFIEKKDDLPATVIPAITPHSPYGVRSDTLAWVAEKAAESGLRMHLHLSETEKEVEDCLAQHGCRPAEYVHRLGLLTPRTLVAHAIHLDAREFELLAEQGVSIAHMPVSNMKLCCGSMDMAAVRARRIRLTLGTDGCSSNNCLDMMQEMKFAGLLAKHTTGDPTAFPASAAYRAATRDAAEAFGLNAGVIAPGRAADCILVDLDNTRLIPGHNRISDMVYSADSSVIDTVLCAGSILMEQKHIAGEAEILGLAHESARRLRGAGVRARGGGRTGSAG